MCDEIQSLIIKRISSNNNYNSDKWIFNTAIKIIQDTQDLQCFNIQDYLYCLDYVENPNKENINEILKYNNIIKTIYIDKNEIAIEDCFKMWLELGINIKLAEELKNKTIELANNEAFVKKVREIYNQMLISYNNIKK